MLDSIRLKANLLQELYILEDEDNPNTSKVSTVYPKTVLDQVIDQYSSTNKTLRTILEELNENVKNHGVLQINFPVTSVNNQTGDVVITKESLGLGNVSNTSDENKPLSDVQRESINNILDTYNFQSKLDFTDYDSHLSDFNNPHHITVEQINKDNALRLFVTNLIYAHNTSADLNIHPDIRHNLAELYRHVEESNKQFNDKLDAARELFIKHYDDPLAHMMQFREKENISNKVSSITDNTINEDNYPSTLALQNFVNQKINEFGNTLPNLSNWYDEVFNVNTRLDLPDADELLIHKLYIIKFGDNNCTEIAYCVKDENDFYEWKIINTGAISNLDNRYLINNTEGITLDISRIAEDLLNNEAIKDLIQQTIRDTFPDVISNYYTKEEIDQNFKIKNLKIVPGIDKGTIRYYINDDITTMSPDVLIRGLQRLSFLEYVTEHEIYDQSIHERHIISNALTTRHFQDKTIYSDFLVSRNKNIILGNINNDNGTIDEIPISSLREQIISREEIVQIVKDTIEEIFVQFNEDEMELIALNALVNVNGGIVDTIPSSMTDEEMREMVDRILDNIFDNVEIEPTTKNDKILRKVVEFAVRNVYNNGQPVEPSKSELIAAAIQKIITDALAKTEVQNN